jgi:hypothetical protein
MIFEYNQHYKTPVIHNDIEYWYDPRTVIPGTDDTPEQTYAEYYGITEDEVEEIILKAKWNQIREMRNLELAKSDWTQVGDVPDNIKLPWQSYRSKLRDLPANIDSPDAIVWPSSPE